MDFNNESQSNFKLKLIDELRLLKTFGLKAKNIIEQMSFEEIDFLLKNEAKIKTFGLNNYQMLNSKYGLYTVKKLFDRSSIEAVETLSKNSEVELIQYIDNLLKKEFYNLGPITIKNTPRLKELYPSFFEETFFEKHQDIINNIFLSSNKELDYSKSIILLKSGLDLSELPITIFEQKVQNILSTLGISKTCELLQTIPTDKVEELICLDFRNGEMLGIINSFNKDEKEYIFNILPASLISKYFNNYNEKISYLQNAWKCIEASKDFDNKKEIELDILKRLGIITLPAIMRESNLYHGIPINLSDYVTREKYNEMIDIPYQKRILFAEFADLFNKYKEEEISLLIDLATKQMESNNILFKCGDRYNGLDLISKIKRRENEGIRTSLWHISRANDFVAYIPEKGENKIMLSEIERNQPYIKDLFFNNYETFSEWMKILKPDEKLPAALISVFDFKNARYVMNSKNIFDNIISNNLFSSCADNVDFQIAIAAAILVFDVFNNPLFEQKILDCYNHMGHYNFIALYKNISQRTNPLLIEDIKNNYTRLESNNLINSSPLINERMIENLFDNLEKYNFTSIDEILNYLSTKYDYNNPICAFETNQMIEKRVTIEYYDHYTKLYDAASKRLALAIPCINGGNKNYTYESVRLWDGKLLNFDIENDIAISRKAKDNLFLKDNCRLIEVRERNGKVIDYIYVLINQQNQLSLTSLMRGDNDFLQQDIIDDISSNLQKKYEQAGISIKINITKKISEDALKNITTPFFPESPQIILEDEEESLLKDKNHESELIKIANIQKLSFLSREYSSFLRDSLCGWRVKKMYYLGRDWYIKLDDEKDALNEEPNKHLNYIARWSIYESKVGSQEMQNCVEEIVENNDIPITVDAFATSYYLFCKLAAEGKIFILKDNLVRVYSERESIKESGYYNQDGSINYNFGSTLNYLKINTGYFHPKSADAANEMKFISSKKISSEQAKKLEAQKTIYSKIVLELEKHRTRDKYAAADEEEWQVIEKEKALKELETFCNIQNLKIYSEAYVKFLLHKRIVLNKDVYHETDDLKYI